MSTTIKGLGRLGNQIIRNLAFSFIAEKNNLYVDYKNKDLIEKLGINLFVGKNIFSIEKHLKDNNYYEIYNSDNIDYNLICEWNDFYQTQYITDLIYNYLRSETIKNNIININPYKERYNYNNDIFIHIRLGDADKWNPGLDYYINCINNIQKYDNIYIGSDSLNHNIIKTLQNKYNNVKLMDYDEINTIQFGTTCKYIILSHGSFSATIGYLSFYSLKIYYPDNKYRETNKWCPMALFLNKGFISP
jgi:hypothetical protein